ncbi:MAG: hypothetical protein ACYCPM_11770 [Acidobacteriaceae bacterium]
MEGVILSEAKNPEGDGGNDQAHIVWILHSAAGACPERSRRVQNDSLSQITTPTVNPL